MSADLKLGLKLQADASQYKAELTSAGQTLSTFTAQVQGAGASAATSLQGTTTAAQAMSRAIDAGNKAHAAGAISAAQHAAAMRMLPAQITDVVTSMASGMPVWMVAIQQGGQIKDSFGGAGNALRAMLGAITPTVAGIGLLAGAAGLAAAAYYQGSKEVDGYRQAVVMTGNAAGTSVNQLTDMARAMSAISGTQGAAAESLTALAGTGAIASENLQQFAAVAIDLERRVGQPIKTTAQHLQELAKAPLQASLKLNEQYHYLTEAVYRQIKALQDQGEQEEAASLAQRTYAGAMAERTAELRSNLGTLERTWEGLGNTARRAWDAMLNIGRAATLSDVRAKIDETNRQLNDLIAGDGFGSTGGGAATGAGGRGRAAQIERLKQQLGELQAQAAPLEAEDAQAQIRAQQQATDAIELAARQRVDALSKSVRSQAEIRRQEIDQLNRDRETLRLSTEEYNKLLAGINEKYKDKKAGGTGRITVSDADLANMRGQLEAARQYHQQLLQLGVGASDLNAAERESLKIAEQLKVATDAKTVAHLREKQAIADALAAQTRSNEGLEKSLKAHQALIDGNYKDAESIAQRARAQEAANEVFGKGRTAIEQMTLAELERQKAEAQGSDRFDPKYIASLELKIAAQKRYVASLQGADYKAAEQHVNELLRGAQELAKAYEDEQALSGLTALEREKIVAQRAVELKYAKELAKLDQQSLTDEQKAAKRKDIEQARDIESAAVVAKAHESHMAKASEEINRSLTDALMRGFEDGKGMAENLADTTVNLFKTMVLRPTISAVMTPVSVAINGVVQQGLNAVGLGSGTSPLAQAQTASSAYNLVSGGMNVAATAGKSLASSELLAQYGSDAVREMAGQFGAGMMNTASWSGFSQAFSAGGAQMAGAIAGSVLNGFSGYGISSMLSGGYSAGSWVNTAAGIASAIPGIGPIAGVVGGAVNRLFGRKLKDQGIEGQFGGEDGFTGNTYQYYKGGLLRSSKTKRGTLDEDLRQAMEDQFNAMRLGTVAMADSLGLGTSAVNSFTAGIKVSFKGLDEAGIQKALAEEFDKIAESMAQATLGTTEYTRTGETSVEAITRLSGSLVTVNWVLGNLNSTLYTASLAGADMASSLVDLFGDAGSFSAATGSYFQNFYSAQEQRDAAQRALQKQLDAVQLTLPNIDASNAREQYRRLTEAQDLNTEAGRRAWAVLVQGSDAFAGLTQSAEDVAKSVQQAAANLRSSLIGLEGKFTSGGFARQYQAEDAAKTIAGLLADVGIEKEIGALTQTLLSSTSTDVESYFREIWSVLKTDDARQQLIGVTDTLLGLASAATSAASATDSATRRFAESASAALSARTTAGSLLDRIDGAMGGTGTAYELKREQELWTAMATASYTQQIDLAGQLTDSVLSRMQLEQQSADKLADIHRSLRDSIEATRTGSLSPLTLGQKVKEAEDQFNQAVAKARAGDTDAAGEVAGLRQNYLQLAQRYYAASDDYTAIFNATENALTGLAGQMQTEAQRQLATSQGTLSELQRLRDITQSAYAQADRDYVTSSAALEKQAALLTSMDGGIEKMGDILKGLPAELAARLQPLMGSNTVIAGVGINGSHANGLERVPFDDYVARLHKDETVLTAHQAEIFRTTDFSDFGRGMDAMAQELSLVRADLARSQAGYAQMLELLIQITQSTGENTAQQLRQAVREVAKAGVKPR